MLEPLGSSFGMEKLSTPSLVRHNHNGGALKLPPGFRFHPTDEELVLQYLRRKVFSCPLPASIIPEIDLGKYNPWDLPGKALLFLFIKDKISYAVSSFANFICSHQ